MKNKCMIINFWLGDRRRFPEKYGQDKTIFLKEQIRFLKEYKNNIDTIYFNFNVEEEQYKILSEALNIIPKNVGKSEIKVNIRKNLDFSYGAYEEIVRKEVMNYKYFIFNEDDYVFVQDNWDDYLINKFESRDNTGYIGMAVRDLSLYPTVKKELGYENYSSVREAFHSVGMTSSENLIRLLIKKGNLINGYGHKGYDEENIRIEKTQSRWSAQFCEIGKINYDVRNEYNVEFQLTDRKEDIWRLFNHHEDETIWNEKTLIRSLRTVLQPNYSWYRCNDYDYQKQKEYE